MGEKLFIGAMFLLGVFCLYIAVDGVLSLQVVCVDK